MFITTIDRETINVELTNVEKKFKFSIPNNKSFLNKVKYVTEDLEFLSKHDETFEEFWVRLHDLLITGLVSFNEDEVLEKLVYYGNKLTQLRVPNVSIFCDQSKRTRDSIFFDEEEITKLLELISIFKFIGFLIHSDYKEKYSSYIQDLLNIIAKHYEPINKKLYQIITSKSLKGSLTNKKYMNFLKFSLSYDYLILYNFSFITNVLICLYNWTKNPVSYIVSLAGENFNYLIMTYSHVPVVYSNTNEDFSLDVASGDFLDSLSYEMILHNIFEKLQKENVTIKNLFPTPVTDIIVIPLMSYITDIPVEYLERKSNYDKMMLQYLIHKFISRNKFLRSQYQSIVKPVNKFLLYAFEVETQYGEGIIPAILEVLKQDFTYYNLDNKVPVLNAVKKFSCFVQKRKHLRNIITGEAFPSEDSKQIQEILKNLVEFVILIVSDETRDEIRKDLKRQMIDFLGAIKLNKMMLNFY